MKKLVIKYKPGCAGEPIALIIERIRNGDPVPEYDDLNRYNNDTPRVDNLAYYRSTHSGIYEDFIKYDEPKLGVFLAHGLWFSTIANLYKKGFAYLYEIVDNTNSISKQLFANKVAYESESPERFFRSYSDVVDKNFYSNKLVCEYESKAFEVEKISYQDIFETDDGYKLIEKMGDIEMNEEWIAWYRQYCKRNREIISE